MTVLNRGSSIIVLFNHWQAQVVIWKHETDCILRSLTQTHLFFLASPLLCWGNFFCHVKHKGSFSTIKRSIGADSFLKGIWHWMKLGYFSNKHWLFWCTVTQLCCPPVLCCGYCDALNGCQLHWYTGHLKNFWSLTLKVCASWVQV